jgi:hypothetical protein
MIIISLSAAVDVTAIVTVFSDAVIIVVSIVKQGIYCDDKIT